MIGLGCGMIGLSVAVFVMSVVYRMTAGKRIKQELREEYE